MHGGVSGNQSSHDMVDRHEVTGHPISSFRSEMSLLTRTHCQVHTVTAASTRKLPQISPSLQKHRANKTCSPAIQHTVADGRHRFCFSKLQFKCTN